MKPLLLLFLALTAAGADTNGPPMPPMPPANSQAEIETLHARISLLEAKINKLSQAPRENTVPMKALSDVASSHYELVGKVEQLRDQVTSMAGTGGTNKPINSHSKFSATCPYCGSPAKSIKVQSVGSLTEGTGLNQEWTVTLKCTNKKTCGETFTATEHSFVSRPRPKREQ